MSCLVGGLDSFLPFTQLIRTIPFSWKERNKISHNFMHSKSYLQIKHCLLQNIKTRQVCLMFDFYLRPSHKKKENHLSIRMVTLDIVSSEYIISAT